jgi:trehalose 6-phosphate synthase
MKQAMVDAMQASPVDLRKRMRALRKQVMENDIERWAKTFLDELAAVRDLGPSDGDD